jgi:anti-sigma regulatory factor (Ser/Thr protein kinase)
MATVEVTFTPLPAHVRTARLVATAVARRSGVAESLLDEVRLAVGEACSRAVEAHQLHCPAEPVRIALTDQAGRFEIEVVNHGRVSGPAEHELTGATPAGAGQEPVADGSVMSADDSALIASGFSLAVIAGLADDVEISETAAGTSVRMSWPSSQPAASGPLA